MKNRIKDEIQGVGLFVGIIWLVFLVDWILPINLNHWGIAPRSWSGLLGIFTMPFLHGNWQHLIGNTIPLAVLLCLLAGSRTNSFRIASSLAVIGGSLLWLLGPGPAADGTIGVHIGASGLIYGLITFLIAGGITERRPITLVIAVFVGLLYGTTLFQGILPFTVNEGISWQGHLAGATAGVLLGRFAVHPAK